MSNFAKKTGDYKHLSATDINVLALTYMLEKEHVGVDHIHTEPVKKVGILFLLLCCFLLVVLFWQGLARLI